MASKRVVKLIDGKPLVLAEFSIKDGKLVTEYSSSDFKREMELFGIFVASAAPRPLFPDDDLAFFNALDHAFANSAFMDVIVD